VRRWFAPTALAALLLVGPALAEEGAPAPVEEPLPLCAAVTARKVDVEVLSSADGRRVNLRLTNHGTTSVAVDLCGGVLVPQEPRACSRLILGAPAEPGTVRTGKPGQVVVHLPAGAERTLLVQTCCLDIGLPLAGKQRLVALDRPARAGDVALMRWWAEFPATSQSAVNAAIWTRRDRVLLDAQYGTAALAWGRGRQFPAVAARGGTLFQLVEGRLSSLDAAGTRCDYASEVSGVLAEQDAVYALFPISHWQAELRRLVQDENEDETAWVLTAYVTEDDRVSRALWLDRDGTLLLAADAILRVPANSAYPERLLPSAGQAGIRIDVRGQATLGLTRRPSDGPPYPVLYDYDPGKIRLSDPQPLKGLRGLRVGPAGVYAVDVEGQLVRVTGEKRERIGDLAVLRSVLTVSRHVVWLRGAGGVPFAVDPDTGRAVARPMDMLGARDQELVLDQLTGDLVGIHRETWFRWRAKGGLTETFPAP
jgi:hypothetical protein